MWLNSKLCEKERAMLFAHFAMWYCFLELTCSTPHHVFYVYDGLISPSPQAKKMMHCVHIQYSLYSVQCGKRSRFGGIRSHKSRGLNSAPCLERLSQSRRLAACRELCNLQQHGGLLLAIPHKHVNQNYLPLLVFPLDFPPHPIIRSIGDR